MKASKCRAASASGDPPGGFRTAARLCAGLAAGLLATAGAALAAGGDQDDALTVVIGSDLRSTDPGVNRDDATDAVLSQVIETLVTFRSDLSIAPLLAESFEAASDGRSYTFHLRPGLEFHDGTAVTAEVVRWNWQRFLDPATQWTCRSQFGADGSVPLVAVEAPDPATVVFRLSRPSPLFLTLLASVQCLPGAYARSSVAADGSWQKPVGTGPFMFETWRRGRDVTLVRNPAYQSRSEPPDGLAGDRTPGVGRLRFMIVPDVTASIQAFNAGQVDVLPSLSPNLVPDLRRDRDAMLVPQPLLGWTVLLLQTRAPLLRDVRMRRAIAHALDRAQVAKIATAGRGRANPSAVPTGSTWRTAAHDQFPPYDPARARALLADAGYRGEPLVIQTNRLYPNMYDNAVMAQALLQAVGINARIEVLDWATQLSNYQSGRFQVSSFSYSARFDPALMYDLLIGDKRERHTAQWESAPAEKLLGEALTGTDDARRREVFVQLHRLMAEEVPIVGLYNGVAVTAVAAGITGYRNWPGATPILWGIHKR